MSPYSMGKRGRVMAEIPSHSSRLSIGRRLVDYRARRTRMSYIDGFVIPVPAGKKEIYRNMAAKAAPIFQEHGALEIVEAWEDDVPDGKVTDFRRAVQAPGRRRASSSPGSSGRRAPRATKATRRSWRTRAYSAVSVQCPSTRSAWSSAARSRSPDRLAIRG